MAAGDGEHAVLVRARDGPGGRGCIPPLDGGRVIAHLARAAGERGHRDVIEELPSDAKMGGGTPPPLWFPTRFCVTPRTAGAKRSSSCSKFGLCPRERLVPGWT